jgi:S1-C subfamily serine protease
MSELEPNQPDVNEVEITEAPSHSRAVRIFRSGWNNHHIWRVMTILLALGLIFQVTSTQSLHQVNSLTDPDTNGYVEPRDLGSILEKLDASVVTIYCGTNKDDSIQGTAWSFELSDITDTGQSALMTNHHVIENCIDGGEITLEDYWGKTFKAELDSYDEVNDLAIISTSAKIPPLHLASYRPYQGYWVLAYGTADGYVGSVATGNIINIDEYGDLLITANISGGNSGGPLIDNEGNVFGVNTWAAQNEEANTQYNISVSLDSFCAELIQCDGDTYWK